MRTQIISSAVVALISCAALFAEQGYDDGSCEDYFGVWGPSSGAAVRITPQGYPCAPTNILLYADAMPDGSEVIVAIWDDDGPEGSPGTMFDGMKVSLDPNESPGWIDIDIASIAPVIKQDSFYAGFAGGFSSYSNGIDVNGPQYQRSWMYYTDCVGRKNWWPYGTGNVMVGVRYDYSRPEGPVENVTGSKKYKRIMHAIIDAQSGDEIVVSPGIYKEQIDFVGKDLVLSSTRPADPQVVEATIIRGKPGTPAAVFENAEDEKSKLCGFMIKGAGPGIYCYQVCPTITNCRVQNNAGPGVEIQSMSVAKRIGPSIVNCTIADNDGPGAVVLKRGHAVFQNCAIIGNHGSGITYGNCEVTNCTIAGNAEYGLYYGLAEVSNSIIWDNLTGSIECSSTPAQVSYSDVEGGFDGAGNINVDPCFVSPGGDQAQPPPADPNPDDNDVNLVAWWRFDEGNGNTAYDSSTYGNHGTISGVVSWVPTGGDAYALDFANGKVLVPDANELRPPDRVSVSAWVNFPLPQDGFSRVVVKGADNHETYSMEIEADHLIFSLREGETRYTVWGWHDIDHNDWTHVAGTYDGLVESCYINGELQDSYQIGQLLLSQNTDGLAIGNAPDISKPFFGMIDEVKVYNKGLTTEEVIGIYDAGKTRYDLPVFSYGGDHHLLPDSPCIDAGNNGAVNADISDLDGDGNTAEPTPWDLDGHPRIMDADCNDNEVVDMGAYEFNYVYRGDFEYDCDVDCADFAILASAWLTEPPDSNWNRFCDISVPADHAITWADVKILTENWLAGL